MICHWNKNGSNSIRSGKYMTRYNKIQVWSPSNPHIKILLNTVACLKREICHLFFSSPVRKAASANEARRVPLPASVFQTAYSLTKACTNIMFRKIFTIYP